MKPTELAEAFFETRLGGGGVRFVIRSQEDSERVRDILSRHLSFSVRAVNATDGGTGPIDFAVDVVSSEELDRGRHGIAWRTRFYEIDFKIDGCRWIVARGRFVAKVEKPLRYAIVSGEQRWEFVAVLLESWVGTLFESQGGVRLHAVALEDEGQAYVHIAPPGWGKSTLAQRFAGSALADEVVFVEGACVLGQDFAIRLKTSPGDGDGLQPLTTIWGPRSVRKVSRTFRSLELRGVSTSEGTGPQRTPNMIRLAWRVFWGLGLQQNPELTFSVRTLGIWLKVAASRIGFIYTVWRRGLHRVRDPRFRRCA